MAVDLLGLEVRPGDRMLVCCDGLSNLVEDAEILRIVRSEPLDAVPQKLVDLANDRGGDDNITVIVLQVGDRLAA